MKRMLWPQTLAVPRVTGAQGSPARVACAYHELWPLSLQPHDRPRRGRLFTAFLKVFAQHTGIRALWVSCTRLLAFLLGAGTVCWLDGRFRVPKDDLSQH